MPGKWTRPIRRKDSPAVAKQSSSGSPASECWNHRERGARAKRSEGLHTVHFGKNVKYKGNLSVNGFGRSGLCGEGRATAAASISNTWFY